MQPLSVSECERLGEDLCINHRPGHVATRQHIEQLVHWLTRRARMNNVRALVQKFGPGPVDAVARDLQEEVWAGADPFASMTRPGAVIYRRVEQRSRSKHPDQPYGPTPPIRDPPTWTPGPRPRL